MTHDQLCPQQPREDGVTLTMQDGKPILCQCNLISQARKDERNAIVQQLEALDECCCIDGDEVFDPWFCDFHRYISVIKEESYLNQNNI